MSDGNFDNFMAGTEGPNAAGLTQVVKTAKGRVDMAYEKGYSQDLRDHEYLESLKKVEDYFYSRIQGEKARIEQEREKSRDAYGVMIGHPRRIQDIKELEIKYNSLGDDEALALAGQYINGQAEIFDPIEIELLKGRVRNQGKIFDQLRHKAASMSYTEPWKHMLTQEDKKIEEITKSNKLPIKYKGEVIGISVKEALEQGGFYRDKLDQDRIQKKFRTEG